MKKNMYILFVFLSLWVSHNLFATDRIWTGATSNNWATAPNWTPSGVPSGSDILIINSATNDPIILSGAANAQKITLSSGATLTVNCGASLNVTSLVAYNDGIALNRGSLVNNGTVTLLSLNETGIGFSFCETATLTNNGTTNCSGSYSAFQIDAANSGNGISLSTGSTFSNLTMTSRTFIGADGKLSSGFQITRTTANSGSTSSISVNVVTDQTMTYNGNLTNNVYAR